MFEFLKDKKGEPPTLPEGTVRRRYSIEGQVQGVGFRYRARYAAQSLELTGWVENEDDGSVTLEVQGELFDFAPDRSYVDFHGNVREYSAVFYYRIYSRELFSHIINLLRTVKRYHAWHKRRETR